MDFSSSQQQPFYANGTFLGMKEPVWMILGSITLIVLFMGLGFLVQYGTPRTAKEDSEFCGMSTLGACESDADCVIGGCSGQICSSKNEGEISTTCEYRDCYDAEKYGFDCVCVNHTCTWAEEECGGMAWHTAKKIAQKSECAERGSLKSEHQCNPVTKTWWIELDLQQDGCSPACVVDAETGEASINWRCTGLKLS